MIENLNATKVDEKIDQLLNILKCAAKQILGFGCFLNNLEVGSFRFFPDAKSNPCWIDRNLKAKLKELVNKTEVNDCKEKLRKLLLTFVNEMDGVSPNQFKEFLKKKLPLVQFVITLKNILLDIEVVDTNNNGELAGRSVICGICMRVLRYDNRLFYENTTNAVFQSFRCLSCDTFFNITILLERHSTGRSERDKWSVRETYIKSQNLSMTSWTFLLYGRRINEDL